MNRTDRLYALVEELRAHAPGLVRVRELAARFEVSTRTIMRDLLALQEAGVPIWAQPGPSGGYALDPKRTLPPLNFTAEEAASVGAAVALGGGMPFSAAGRSAARKLGAVMAACDLEPAMRLAGRIWVASNSVQSSRVAAEVEAAVLAGSLVRLRYRDGGGRTSTREVEAHGLVGSRRGWYLVAWCRMRGEGRRFRLDRIVSCERTGEVAPHRDVEPLLGWARSVAEPVVSLVRPGEWKGAGMDVAELLSKLDRDEARWDAALDSIGRDRMLELGACGEWSMRDVVNHVNVYRRFSLVQLRGAVAGIAQWAWDEGMGARRQPGGMTPGSWVAEEFPDTLDGRNAMFHAAGRELTVGYLLDESRSISRAFRDWISERTADELDARIGWIPYWDPAFPRDEGDQRLLRLASEVPAVADVKPLWALAAEFHEHGMSHARDALVALGLDTTTEPPR